ncbi:MAG: hypothetical protein R3Y04_02285 [Rikenellaceae bacterium]
MHSLNKVDKNIEAIGAMFPDCLTERKGENDKTGVSIDFNVLSSIFLSTVIQVINRSINILNQKD